MTNQKSIDAPSYAGQFGWEGIGPEEFAVPVILRSNNVRYSPVKIVEQEIIKKYDTLPQTVFQVITLKSFFVTNIEAKLLNTINYHHCNGRYGDTLFTSKDVIISAADVRELSRFLNLSHHVFTQEFSEEVKCKLGIIRLVVNPSQPTFTLLVPYICKRYPGSEGAVRFVPDKLIAPYVKHSNKSVRSNPNDWDIMYLKMLSIRCGNNSVHKIKRDDFIVRLEGLIYPDSGSPIIYDDCNGKEWTT